MKITYQIGGSLVLEDEVKSAEELKNFIELAKQATNGLFNQTTKG